MLETINTTVFVHVLYCKKYIVIQTLMFLSQRFDIQRLSGTK